MTARSIPLPDLLVQQGPVITARERARLLDGPRASGVAYTGAPVAPFPVMPLQVFGIHYDLDLVLADDHPAWDMHEYALVQTRTGPTWLAKDTRTERLRQTIVAPLAGLRSLIPEIPLERDERPVDVVDTSDDRHLRLELRYRDLGGEDVVVRYEGARPWIPRPKHNSSTMGHSADHLIAVLDIPRMAFARRASVTIGGRLRRPYRILGLAPLSVAIVQTQGGFAIGAFTQRATADGVQTVHVKDGVPDGVRQAWSRREEGAHVVIEQEDDVRVLRFVYRRDGEALELLRAEAWGWTASGALDATPNLVAHFAPAIPDLRRPFAGPWRGRYVLDVRDQPSHGVGDVRVERGDGVDRVFLDPESPRWTVDRPMVAEVRVRTDDADVRVARRPAG